MKRFYLPLISVILLIGMLLVGCGDSDETSTSPSTTPSTAPSATVAPYEWPATLEFLAPNTSESRYQELASIAPLLEESTGAKVRLISEDATATKMKWIISGQYLFNAEGVSGLARAIMGTSAEYANLDCHPFPLRVVWDMQDGSLGFATQADSGIRTLDDIQPGIKIGIPPMATLKQHVLAFLSWCEIDEEDVVFVPFGDWPSAAKALIDEKVDLSYVSVASSYMPEIEAGPHGVYMIETDPAKDPAGAARFLEISPTMSFGVCTAGIDEAIGKVMNLVPTPLYTHADTDTELVYNLVKWFVENYDSYEDKYSVNYQMSVENMRAFLDTTFLPIHEGTIQYLREIGMWTAADDESQAANVALADQYVQAFEDAVADAEGQGISVDPSNQDWLDLWASYRTEIPVLKTRVK